MKRPIIRNGLLLALLTFTTTTFGFGTWNAPYTLGQHTEHELITRAALWCGKGHPSDGKCFEDVSMEQLAGRPGDVGLGNVGGVGAPDFNKFALPPSGETSHFDNADFLDERFLQNGQPYPRSREEASAKLMESMIKMRERFDEGKEAAAGLLDKNGVISPQDVFLHHGLLTWECTFAGHFTSKWLGAEAKCNVFDGFGRALHGVQDFYSHSNYADKAGPATVSISNPPGLGRNWPSPLLDLQSKSNYDVPNPRSRSDTMEWQLKNPGMSFIPWDLSTGCFTAVDLLEVIPLACPDRIRHKYLEKDHGQVNLPDPYRPTWQTGGATAYTTTYPPVGKGSERSDIVLTNFDSAANMAVKDTIRQWTFFRDALRTKWGTEKGNLMICSLVRDEPTKDCYGRRIAIVVDSSGSNAWTDPTNQRIKAAMALNKGLTTSQAAADDTVPDRVIVIDFDDSASVISPMGDPSKASFAGIDASGGTDIGSGISLAIDEILKADTDPAAHKSGIIVLTDGVDGNPANQIKQLKRATKEGIRVSIGFLDPNSLQNLNKRHLSKRDPAMDLLFAILQTGGVYSTINSAEAQQNFIKLVSDHGLTDMDSPSGLTSVSTFLLPELTIADLISVEPRWFLYSAKAGERLNITVTRLSPSLALEAVLHDVGENFNITTLSVNSTKAVFQYEATADTQLRLEVIPLLANMTEGAFTVGLRTHLPPIVPVNNTTSTNSTTNGTNPHPVGTGTGSGSYPTGVVSGLWSNVTSSNSSIVNPTITVITTSSVTICPLTTTAIDGPETRVIATDILSTVYQTITQTLPCPKCPGYVSGYAPVSQVGGATAKGSSGNVQTTSPNSPASSNAPGQKGSPATSIATGDLTTSQITGTVRTGSLNPSATVQPTGALLTGSSNASTVIEFTGVAGMKATCSSPLGYVVSILMAAWVFAI